MPFFVTHRRVGEGEMRLLGIAVAEEREGDVVHMGGLAGIGAVEDRADLVHHVEPDLREGFPESGGMALAEDWRVAVIVEHDALWPPGDEHRLACVEHHGHERLQRLRPGGGLTERRGRPVMHTHERSERAATLEEDRGRLTTILSVHSLKLHCRKAGVSGRRSTWPRYGRSSTTMHTSDVEG